MGGGRIDCRHLRCKRSSGLFSLFHNVCRFLWIPCSSAVSQGSRVAVVYRRFSPSVSNPCPTPYLTRSPSGIVDLARASPPSSSPVGAIARLFGVPRAVDRDGFQLLLNRHDHGAAGYRRSRARRNSHRLDNRPDASQISTGRRWGLYAHWPSRSGPGAAYEDMMHMVRWVMGL